MKKQKRKVAYSTIEKNEQNELEIRDSGRAIFVGFSTLDDCKRYVEKQKISLKEIHEYIQKEFQFIMDLEKEVINANRSLQILSHMLDISSGKDG